MPAAYKVPRRDDLITAIRRLRKQARVADYYGVSVSTVSQWGSILEIDGNEYVGKTKKPSKSDLLALIETLGCGKAVAKQLGVRNTTVYAWTKSYGIKLQNGYQTKPTASELVDLLEHHGNVASVSRAIGNTRGTISKWAKGYGITTKVTSKKKQVYLTDEDKDLIFALRKDLTVDVIAEKFDCTAQTIRKAIAKY